MCGINGFIKFGDIFGLSRKAQMETLVHSMNERIIHRGPDSEGMYADEHCALGMRRLSIIDLDTGSQPIFNSSHDKLILFNGEIYNYRELRKELSAEGCRFVTKSDTEVVLLGIELYGKRFIKRLDGMFAFCIYDSVKHTWLLARDKAGEKPLYYYMTDKFFLFGSELKSLMVTGLVPKEIDMEALTTYFQLAYIPAPMCIWQGVKKLMPATIMEIKHDGTVDTESYWKLEIKEDDVYGDYEYCKKQLRQKLFNSVCRRMISDVSLGAFLSGGFDSSIIVGIMSEVSSHPIDTFTIGFKEKAYDERELAAVVSKKNGTNHHIFILDWEKALKEIDTIFENMDEPFADPSLVATYAVCKMTREFVSVALTGDASDELFAGYNKYLMPYYENIYGRIPQGVRSRIVEPLSKRLSSGSSLYRKVNKVIDNMGISAEFRAKRMMSRAFKFDEVKHLMPGIEINQMKFIDQQFRELKGRGVDDQKRIQYVDYNTVLEGQMLPKVDRASMLTSLETRVPMLAQDIVELAFNMPSEFKIKGLRQKIILKDAFRDLLPDELFRTQKHGFDVPVGAWMDSALKGRMDKYSSIEFIDKQGIFDWNFIETVMNKWIAMDVDSSTRIWTFFVFQNWYDRYLGGA